MKKIYKFIALVLLSLLCFSSCTAEIGDANSQTTPESTPNISESVNASEEVTTTVEVTTSEEPNKEIPKSLKILAIGNSFSTDCMQYLSQLLKEAGVENIILGNLYYGGCSLDQHLSFATSDSASYTYYKTTDGNWKNTKNYKMSSALKDEEWDYISFQQTSKTCGLTSSYKNLGKLVSHVREKAPNAKFIWNMTWAYQQDSTHSSFPNYSSNQITMYNMIIDCVNKCISAEKEFEIIIPCMTSIQNARTSFLGDTLTRDGYHLDYGIGKYIAALTWCAMLTGTDVSKLSYNPSSDIINEDMLNATREAVANAVTEPLKITESKIKQGTDARKGNEIDPGAELNPADFYEADLVTAQSQNIDLSKYTLLEWNYITNTYWNCTSKAGTTTPNTSAGTYNQNVCSARKYSLAELPLGTVFITDTGWQFRPEIYKEENAKYTGTRPSMVTDRVFVLSSDFIKDCNYISWNISSNPKRDISAIFAQAACHLRIYIPKAQ